MAERPIPPTSAQESSPLHERGGLTPEHWQAVISRLGKEDEVTETIIAYAQKVISGEFPDSGLHHRNFLDWVHWRRISDLSPYDIREVKRRFLVLTYTDKVLIENQLIVEGTKFARDESMYLWVQEHPHLQEIKRKEIHERGSLTRNQWNDVLKTMGRRVRSPEIDDTVPLKIVRYAQAAIDGKIQDSNYTHRDFLGSRHWEGITNVFGSKAPMSMQEDEVLDYAIEERYEQFTLDDYFDKIKHWPSIEIERIQKGRHTPDDTKKLVFVNGQWWYQHFTSELDPTPAPLKLDGTDDWGNWRNVIKDKQPPNAWNLKLVSNRWLLEPEDVDDLLHTSPEQLVHIARNRIPVDVLTTRLRDYLDRIETDWQKPWYIIMTSRGSQVKKIRGWEKPIPEAT